MKGHGCGCATGGARRTRRHMKHRRARSEKRRKHSKRQTRSRKHHKKRRSRRRARSRRSRRGGSANTFLPQALVNTFRDVSNAVQTKYADLTGGPVPISPSVLKQTAMKKPNEPSVLAAIRPIKTSPNSPTKKVSPFRQKK